MDSLLGRRNRRAQPARWVMVACAVGLVLSSCTTPAEPPRTPPQPTGVEETASTPFDEAGDGPVIGRGLDAPWSVTFAGQTPLISERDSGRILAMDEAGAFREVGVLTDIAFGGEGGLLGLAWREPDELFVYSTGEDGNRIQRFTLQGEPGSHTLSEPATLISGLPSASIHNGGRIALGPDGMLYAGVGDAGNRSLPQDLDSLGGKILRMTPNGQAPPDNPFGDSLVFSYGHRNVQGLAWDADGVMYASEFGQNRWDELNIITAGANYGWPEVEGPGNSREGFTLPIAHWPTDEASPSGITIRERTVYLANLRGQRLRSVDLDDPRNQSELWVGDYGRFRDIVSTPDGQLWALTNNTDGRGSPGPEDDLLLRVDPELLAAR